jgi:glycosyltransferase involved in cell wall biosynthesis
VTPELVGPPAAAAPPSAPPVADPSAGRPLRVALVTFQLGEYCVRLANALADRCEVALLVADTTDGWDAVPADPRVSLRVFRHPRLRQPVRQLRSCRTLLREIERLSPDVVHLQQGHTWFNLFLPALARRRPLVITAHDPRHHLGDRDSHKTPQALVDFGFRRASAVIVHGEAVGRGVVAACGVSRQRVRIVPHHRIGGGSTAPPPPPGPPSVLFFGRIWPYKGLDELIRAQPLVSATVPDARFVIAGEGESIDRYRAMMADPSRFDVHNRFVSNDERDRLFRETSLVVLPYVEATQSGVIPVAYAHGRPVVTTSVGALAEAVDDGVTGLVVPPRDAAALADAMVRILGDPALRASMCEAARRKADSDISADTAAAMTLDVYREAAGLPAR